MKVPRNKLLEAGLVNLDPALRKLRNLFRIDVNAGYVHAEFRETGSGYQPNISGSEYSNLHPARRLR